MNRILADDRGNATILAAFAIAALTSIIVIVLYLGAAVVARHRAQSAADLAALAAAIAHAGADGEPCAAARDLASAQHPPAVLAECRLDGDDVVVRARIPVELGGLGIRDATAQARAGPV